LKVFPTPPVLDPKVLVDVTTLLDTLEDLLGVGRFTVSTTLNGRRSADVGVRKLKDRCSPPKGSVRVPAKSFSLLRGPFA
jgi:hypothetical protein